MSYNISYFVSILDRLYVIHMDTEYETFALMKGKHVIVHPLFRKQNTCHLATVLNDNVEF